MIVVSFVVDLLITKQIPARRVSLTPGIHRVAGNRQNNEPAIVVESEC
jgi:hypothetical protein